MLKLCAVIIFVPDEVQLLIQTLDRAAIHRGFDKPEKSGDRSSVKLNSDKINFLQQGSCNSKKDQEVLAEKAELNQKCTPVTAKANSILFPQHNCSQEISG